MNRAEWEGPSILEIMLNQGQLGEGVEPKARQRLKRMCQWHLNGQKSEEYNKTFFKKKAGERKKQSFSSMADTFFWVLKQMLRQMVVN